MGKITEEKTLEDAFKEIEKIKEVIVYFVFLFLFSLSIILLFLFL